MPLRLSTSDPDFEARFSALLTMKREVSADVDQAVHGILADVRTRGDAALIELSQKFDSIDLGKVGLRVTAAEVDRAVEQCSKETLDALTFARDRIADHHQRHLPQSEVYADPLGVELGHRWTAVES